MAQNDNTAPSEIRIVGQIELPEIKQENRELQRLGSTTKVLPNGMYQIDSSQKWQVGAVIFYDATVNEFGMIAVKAKHASAYRFQKAVKRGSASLDRGDLVIFLARGRNVEELIPVRSVANLPWGMILRHVDFYKDIEFEYTIDRVTGRKGSMSVPVIETCLRHAKEADELNMVKTLYRKLRSAETEEIMEEMLRKVFPCGVRKVFEKRCLNMDYAASLMQEENSYMPEYRVVVTTFLKMSIEDGDLATAAKCYVSFNGFDDTYGDFLSALNAKSDDWNALVSLVRSFPVEEDGADFLLDILRSETDEKPTPEVILAAFMVKKTPAGGEAALPYEELFRSLPAGTIRKDSMARILETEKTHDGRMAVIDVLPENMVMEIVVESFPDTPLAKSYLRKLWEKASCLDYACIDIESDNEYVSEAASVCGDKTSEAKSQSELPEVITAIAAADMIIGHNIKEWDLPILGKKGLVVRDDQFIWDTYEMELILDPTRFSYALEGPHTAVGDARLCEKLFWNQVYRLADSGPGWGRLGHVFELFPESVKSFFARIQNKEYHPFLKEKAGVDTVFFRQQSLLDKTLEEKLDGISGRSLILAPSELWPAIASRVRAVFPSAKGIEYLSVSESAVNGQSDMDPVRRAVLRTFTAPPCNPLVARLSSAARVLLPDDVLVSCSVDPGLGDGVICTDSFGVEDLGDLGALGITDIYVTGYEIESRMNSMPLGEPFCAADLLNNPLGAKLLMQLSGATFVPVRTEDCAALHLPELPPDVQNIWMRKDEKGLFQVYCNRNFSEFLSALTFRYPAIVQHQVQWLFSDTKESRITVVATKRNPRFNATMKRVNPTSLYRSMYWTYQFALLCRASVSPLKVLYVANPLEVEPVRAYAESQGFYVPPGNIPVQRRIELCAARTSLKKMVVIGPAEFKVLRESRIEQQYCLIWDNLDTDSLQVMWRHLLPFGDEPKYEAERKEQEEGIPSALSCVLAVWPMVKYYYRQMARQNPQNELVLLDPCFDDYRELEKSFLATRQEVTLWENEEAYKESLQNAQHFFAGAKREEDLDIDFEKAKDTIRQVFLDPKTDTPPATWYPIQEKALPQVFHRRSHSLIAIPTGGGKSVLFQGPALYRAAFTNRLSIVITPLKALMQDQVNNLQDLGFLTNVEYLNSDKSRPETSRIYRKVTGGEIALLYVTPERFRSRGFRTALELRMEMDGGLEYIIFDEAHCISQWGLDFRPEYLSTAQTCARMAARFPGTCIELFSATVTGQVRDDIERIVHPVTAVGADEPYNPVRNHIGMEFMATEDTTEGRAALLAREIEASTFNPAISRVLVFSRTRKMTEEVCALLKESLQKSPRFSSIADKVGYFHAGMDAEDRSEAFDKFRDGEYVILVATKAFGMGMDIPNIHYVYHLSPPQFVEDYLQEVGRAGRKKKSYEDAGFREGRPIPTKCFVSPDDFRSLRDLLAQGLLSWEDVRAIYAAVKEYVGRFQPASEEQKVPIAVPDNIWKKETAKGAVADSTAFRLGLYWLERMKRIDMGYYAMTTLDIALPTNRGPSVIPDKKLNEILLYIVSESTKWKDPQNIQIYINDICSQLSIGQHSLFRYIVQGTRMGLFSVQNKTAFSLTKLRMDEVKYCTDRRKPYFVADTVFEATRILLSGIEVRKTASVDLQKRNLILENAVATTGLIEAADEAQNRDHMPWYTPAGMGITTKKTYERDIRNKRAKFMFAIVDMLPDASVKSIMDQGRRQVIQEIYLSSGRWSTALAQLKQDSVRLIGYLARKFFRNERDFIWTDVIRELNLPESYQYLCDLFSIVRMLGFINADGILSTGIEITLTDNRDDVPESPEGGLDRDVYDEFTEVNFLKEVKFSLMDTFRDIPREKFDEFIQAYFGCKTREEYMAVLSRYNSEDSDRMKALQKVAIKTQEDRLDEMQREIYDESIDEDINVVAGPGSGKTHVLTLRCAKLVYHHHVLPQNILVLAYNRAVVEELKSRLSRLFNELGYGRSMSQLQIYTFHGMAKKYCYDRIKDKPMEEWESTFLDYISAPDTMGIFRADMGNVQHILIDEFQDITQVRLDLMLKMREILTSGTTSPRFFTIGDINQSIYGFDKAKQGHPMDPVYYYRKLENAIHPKRMCMTTNYRSYQGILDEAFKFIPGDEPELLPHSSEKLVPPEGKYVFIKNRVSWFAEFPAILQGIRDKNRNAAEENAKVRTVALFFRSNSEVYRGYSHLRGMNLHGVRIRVQGSSGEFFRTRECYSMIETLKKTPDKVVPPDMKQWAKAFLENQKQRFPAWDAYYLDLTYALVLDFLATMVPGGATYSDLAEFLEDIGERDDGQLSKVYQKHKEEFPPQDETIEIILTTMHKVKGLEFDAVIVTPSYQPLGYTFDGQLEGNWEDLIGEERRLYYVAYTRAKKYLYAYRYPREEMVEQGHVYWPSDELQRKLGHSFDQGLDKFNISYTAQNFNLHDVIYSQIRKDDRVVLERNGYGDGWNVLYCGQGGRYYTVGVLSRRENSFVNRACVGRNRVDGLFVSDVYVWRYEDTVRSDNAKGSDYASKWAPGAVQNGFILIVDIAGYTGG